MSAVQRSMRYAQVLFDRGPGLGTRLFAWARCALFSEFQLVPMLAPRWHAVRIGPLLRGGIGLPSYHRQILLVGVFQPRAAEISGVRKHYVRLTGRRFAEP